VVSIGGNSFRTMFPNKAELQRMVEWGVVQIKFDNAKLKIVKKNDCQLLVAELLLSLRERMTPGVGIIFLVYFSHNAMPT
jgi:hypothetical protein